MILRNVWQLIVCQVTHSFHRLLKMISSLLFCLQIRIRLIFWTIVLLSFVFIFGQGPLFKWILDFASSLVKHWNLRSQILCLWFWYFRFHFLVILFLISFLLRCSLQKPQVPFSFIRTEEWRRQSKVLLHNPHPQPNLTLPCRPVSSW